MPLLAAGSLAQKGAAPPTDPSAVRAKSALVVEEKSGKVLWERAADAKRFPASTTKILTALLLLERCRPEDRIVAPAEIETIEGASLHLKPGESVSARDMLYAIMLRSANDGCHATAQHIGGSLPAFAELMNKRAKEIGCKNTSFRTPSGLHDPLHYTTARDLFLMAREAMQNPEFRAAARTRKRQIGRTMNQEDTWLISKNRFLAWDPTYEGIKTGYTNPAGHCFVGCATRNGIRVYTVILASDDWKVDQKLLMDWAFKNHRRSEVASKGGVIGKIAVQGGVSDSVPVAAAQPVLYAHRLGVQPSVRFQLESSVPVAAPVRKGQALGFAVASDGSGWTMRVPVAASEDVAAAEPLAARSGWGFGVGACTLALAAYAMRRRAKRMAQDLGRARA